MKFPKFTALLLAGSLALSVAACGKPSVEGSEKRFKSNKDKISVLITKQPASKAEFEKKLAEFEAEYTEALKAGSDEDKIKKLGDLNSRMEKYIAQFDKPDGKKAGGAAAPSGKLDKNGTAPATGPAPAGGGGKLGGGSAQPASGGMGGGSAPAGGGMGGGTAQPSSGMGGGAPAGGSAPAQPASGGMGGM